MLLKMVDQNFKVDQDLEVAWSVKSVVVYIPAPGPPGKTSYEPQIHGAHGRDSGAATRAAETGPPREHRDARHEVERDDEERARHHWQKHL